MCLYQPTRDNSRYIIICILHLNTACIKPQSNCPYKSKRKDTIEEKFKELVEKLMQNFHEFIQMKLSNPENVLVTIAP